VERKEGGRKEREGRERERGKEGRRRSEPHLQRFSPSLAAHTITMYHYIATTNVPVKTRSSQSGLGG